MSNQLLFRGKKNELLRFTVEDFCNTVAIVIDPSDEDQIWVQFTKSYQSPLGKEYEAGDQYTLSSAEKRYIQEALGIKINLPETDDEEEDGGNSISIGGSVQGSNIVMGNNNSVTQALPGGGSVNLIITGNNVTVEQVK
jgi:hypothetical protein